MRRPALLIACAIALLAALPAAAQTYPTKPIRIVVPFVAGGTVDLLARIMGQKLTESLGQPVIIENRPGAGGNAAADAVAKSPPDGYTILQVTNGLAIGPALYRKLPFDPVKDLIPVTQLVASQLLLVATPSLPVKNTRDVIELAKAKPGTLNYGSAGPASLAHLASAMFANMAGIDITHVPYKSSSQSMTDMITGRLEMQFATIAPSLANIRSGQLRALAVSGAKRVTALPDVPTVAEEGIAGYEAALWISFVMPPATPAAIVTRLNREVNQILTSDDGRDALVAQGVEPEPGPPEALTARIRTDTVKWRKVIDQAGIKAGQ